MMRIEKFGILKTISASLVVFLFMGCISAPPPVDEYTIARTAMEAARVVESARYSPGYWHQAEEAYRRAQALFRDHEYEESKVEFLKARQAAEKAENSARLIRQKNGEVL
jgi:hypothetical protein